MTKIVRSLIAGIGIVTMAGIVQAAPIQMTSIATYSKGNTNWQDVKGVSYTWLDVNKNNKVDVGEKVTFTVDMHKNFYGSHDFDALKVWLDKEPTATTSTKNVLTYTTKWDYTNENMAGGNYNNDWNNNYSWKWVNKDTLFSFDYTFQEVGAYDLTASVMCSRDLSGLTYPTTDWKGNYDPVRRWDDKVTINDWNAWSKDVHKNGTVGAKWNSNIQGETEKYKLVVYQEVPEPSTVSLLIIGLTGLSGALLARRKK